MNCPPHPIGDLPRFHHPERHGVLCSKSENAGTINSITEIKILLVENKMKSVLLNVYIYRYRYMSTSEK